MAVLTEKARLLSEKISGKKHFFRAAPILFTLGMLIYYCTHPKLYSSDGTKSILMSVRTYEIMLLSAALISLWLVTNELSDRINRILSWVWFLIAPFAVYFSLLYLNADKYNIDFFALDKIALALTFAFLYLVQGILFGLTGSIRFSVIIYAVAVAVLGIANCFVISFRGMAISAGDLFSLSTAATVASEYTYSLDWYMVMEILFTFLICTISLKLKRGRMMPLAARGAFLAVFVMLAGGYYYLCGKTTFLEDHDIRSEGFTHQLRYKKYDMLFTTLVTCFYMVVDKPDGYSLEAVREIAADYVADDADDGGADGADGDTAVDDGAMADDGDDAADSAAADGDTSDETATPNIIVIMNESWADYTDIGNGLELSEDYMPYIRSLTENTIKGTAYASIFGANTPNSEYEFLTGNTMAFLPASSVGFNLFVRGNLPSLASQLGTLGYYTLAMHPYRGTNYRRNIVYPQIGFDTYYTRDDFSYPYKIRNYISDRTLFDRITLEYEANLDSGQPLFSYNVTVQNHGGYYSSNTKNLSMSIEVLNTGFSTTRAEIYVNLVKATDDAFKSLVEYFEDVDDPTVIVMFGDHQPDIGDGAYEYLLGGTEEDLTSEELMEKYKIPFIIWANYDIEEEIIEGTSLNYLYSIMADRLGLSMTGYQEYLLDLSEQIPVLNSVGYWGADGNFYELDDEESPYYKLVNEYNILEYNDIFGGDNRYYEFLPWMTMRHRQAENFLRGRSERSMQYAATEVKPQIWDGGFMEKSPRNKKKRIGIPVRLLLPALLIAAVSGGSPVSPCVGMGILRAAARESAVSKTAAVAAESETEAATSGEAAPNAAETEAASKKGNAGKAVAAIAAESETEESVAEDSTENETGKTAASESAGEAAAEDTTEAGAASSSALTVPDELELRIAQMTGIETETETEAETETETETEVDLTAEIHRAVRSQIWEIQTGNEFQAPMAASDTDLRPTLPVTWSCGRLFTWYSGGLYPWQQERTMEKLEQLVRATVEDYDGSWSVYVKNLDTDESFVINDEPMKSASVMKLFIMGTVYTAFDEGELERTDEIMSLVNLMISNSDNTASNQLLYILGDSSYADGIAKVNEFIQSHGYSEMTVEYNGFSNSATNSGEGINQVAAKDVGALLEDIYRRTWMSRAQSNEMEEMLLAQNTRYKIPAGLPDGVLCGNKTGEMSDTQNDAAIIYSDECDYILVVLSNGWSSSDTAIQRIKNISTLVYEYFN